jgi:hypothetical protein
MLSITHVWVVALVLGARELVRLVVGWRAISKAKPSDLPAIVRALYCRKG